MSLCSSDFILLMLTPMSGCSSMVAGGRRGGMGLGVASSAGERR
jgi:hypothetical protein